MYLLDPGSLLAVLISKPALYNDGHQLWSVLKPGEQFSNLENLIVLMEEVSGLNQMTFLI